MSTRNIAAAPETPYVVLVVGHDPAATADKNTDGAGGVVHEMTDGTGAFTDKTQAAHNRVAAGNATLSAEAVAEVRRRAHVHTPPLTEQIGSVMESSGKLRAAPTLTTFFMNFHAAKPELRETMDPTGAAGMRNLSKAYADFFNRVREIFSDKPFPRAISSNSADLANAEDIDEAVLLTFQGHIPADCLFNVHHPADMSSDDKVGVP
jgi:hypothetical protein